MKPDIFYEHIVVPTLDWMSVKPDLMIPVTDAALVLVMTIAGQESNWQHRKQIGGPARSYWQFEQGGGVAGVLQHPASAGKIKTICGLLDVPCDTATVYEAMAWHDTLACSMARLLLWTDAAALPAPGQQQAAWDCYLRNWRPGAPHPDAWPALYQQSMEIVVGNPPRKGDV